MDIEDTLTEVDATAPNNIEKPKRKATEKQLAALAAARAKRVTKPNALKKVAEVFQEPEPIVEPIVVKKPKVKKPVKPIIIQMEESSSSEEEQPTVIIRNTKKKAATKKPTEPVTVAEPAAPIQYIRRAY
jgi:hypothetical protein